MPLHIQSLRGWSERFTVSHGNLKEEPDDRKGTGPRGREELGVMKRTHT